MKKQNHNEWDLAERGSRNPFKTPEGYFESLEDRIMERVDGEPVKSSGSRVIQLLKPALGLVASITLVYMLVYYPLSRFLPDYLARTEQHIEQPAVNPVDEYLRNLVSFMNESALYDILGSDHQTAESAFETEELLDYLVLAVNDYDIYTEFKNQ